MWVVVGIACLRGAGLESAQRIRQWEAQSGALAVPIIAASGEEADSAVVEACLESGGRDFSRHALDA